MPNPNSLDALKRLLGASSDLNVDDASSMPQMRISQKNHAEEDMRRYENANSDPYGRSFTGASPSTYAHLKSLLSDDPEGPTFGTAEKARIAGINQANSRAMQEGFTGDSDIAGPAEDASGGFGHKLYANVGDRSGLSPAQMAGRSATMMEAAKTNAPVDIARINSAGDVAKQRMANQGQQDLERLKRQGMQDSFNQFLQLKPGSMATHTPTGQPAVPQGQPQAEAKPQESQSWMDFITGKGPNSLRAATDAFSERQKYGMMSTPMAPAIQNESFGNLEQLQAQFPGVRGFGYLLDKLKEHQSHFGQGLQTPQASYDRLGGMDTIFDQMASAMQDPSSHMAQAANGEWHFTSTPASVQRALAAITDTRERFKVAREHLQRQYPELNPQQQQQAAPSSGRFTRVE